MSIESIRKLKIAPDEVTIIRVSPPETPEEHHALMEQVMTALGPHRPRAVVTTDPAFGITQITEQQLADLGYVKCPRVKEQEDSGGPPARS